MGKHAARRGERDIAEGALVRIHVEDFPPDGLLMPMSAVLAHDTPLGPPAAGFVDRLKGRRTARPAHDAGLSAAK